MKPVLIPGSFLLRVARVIEDRGIAAYLVGGHLRDLVMSRKSKDADFAVNGAADVLACKVADETGGYCFLLDKGRGTARVIYPADSELDTLDFTRMQGGSIQADLGNRDFTLDAMAVDPHFHREIIDPFNGLEDIKRKTIKAVSDGAMADDPARTVRAFRLAAVLGFDIEDKTLDDIKRTSHLLEKVSGERIRNEIVRILDRPDSSSVLHSMKDVGLLKGIFSSRVDIDSVEDLERSVAEIPADDSAYLSEELESGVSRLVAFKIATVLKGAGPEALETGERLKLSRKSVREMKAYAGKNVSIVTYLSYKKSQSVPPLVSGKDLIKDIGATPGPLMGSVLKKLREQQLAGLISKKSEALKAAKEYLGIM